MKDWIRFPNAYGKKTTSVVIELECIAEFLKMELDTSDGSLEQKELGKTGYYIRFYFKNGKQNIDISFWNEENRDKTYDEILKWYGVKNFGTPPFVEVTTKVHPSQITKES